MSADVTGQEPGAMSNANEQRATQWTLWQLCDSALPTGGFAHSAGLEAAAAARIVQPKDVESLMRFVRGNLANAASLQLPLVLQAHRGRTLEAWIHVDGIAHACITGEASRRASLSQGAGLLRAAQTTFLLSDYPDGIIRRFRDLVRLNEASSPGRLRTPHGRNESRVSADELSTEGRIARGHHAPAFGIVCRALGIESADAARAFMFLTARDMLSAATRLSLIGPLEAGRLLNSLNEYSEALITRSEKCERQCEPMWVGDGSQEISISHQVYQVDPLQEIIQGTHDRLYSRMFNT